MKTLIQRLWSIQAVRVFTISGALYLLAFQICRERFWRDPHSAFFNDDQVYEFEYSAQRQVQADGYIESANTNQPGDSSSLHKAGEDVLICGAFVTVKREGPVFPEAIGSMLMNLTEAERERLYVYTLFGNTDPTVHDDWGKPWVDALLDDAGQYDIHGDLATADQLDSLRRWESDHEWHRKGLFDYRYALRKCYEDTEAPYIAIFEDDIIFAEGWLVKTMGALEDLGHKRTEPGWLYLRLFFTETSMMWSVQDFWYRNMWLAFALGILSSLAALLYARRKFAITNLSVVVLALVTVPAFIGMVFMIGKYSLAPMEGVVPMDEGGCCTQALVYPRALVPDLVTYLKDRMNNPGQTDVLIEEYAADHGLGRFALAPQVVQHVGRKSSRDNTAIDTKSVWAFHFEASSEQELHEEHEELMASVMDSPET